MYEKVGITILNILLRPIFNKISRFFYGIIVLEVDENFCNFFFSFYWKVLIQKRNWFNLRETWKSWKIIKRSFVVINRNVGGLDLPRRFFHNTNNLWNNGINRIYQDIAMVRCGWPEACLGYEYLCCVARSSRGKETEGRKNWNAVTVFCLPLSCLNRAPVQALRRLFLTSDRFSGEACNWWTVERKGTTPAIVALKYTATGRSGSNSRMPDVVDSRSNRSELVHAPSLNLNHF